MIESFLTTVSNEISRSKTDVFTTQIGRLFVLLLGPKDACGQIGSSPVCCTYDIVNSYAISLGIELKLMADVELNRLTVLLLSSKQQIDGK